MRIFPFLAAAALPLALAACGDKAPEETTATQDETVTEPETQLGIVLSDAAVRLPAVSGRPAAAYFTFRSMREEPVRIVSASVMGAGKAELHETKMVDGVSMMATAGTILLEPGETVTFAPGGFHVMLFDLDGTLAAGDTTDLTLTLENGDKISAVAQVVGAGDPLPGGDGADTMMDHGTMDHGTMDHGDMDHAAMDMES